MALLTNRTVRRIGVYTAVALGGATAMLLALRARAAGIPDAAALTYTGYLENPDGTPATGTKGIGISLYDAETDGTEVCAQKPSDIEPISGRFQLTLPEKCTAAVKANPNLWVEVQVEGSLLGRTTLGAVPYAIEAAHAVAADTAAGELDARLKTIETNLAELKKAQPVLTGWQTYQPVLSSHLGVAIASQTTNGNYRRVGDSLEVWINTTFTDVPASGANWYQWSIPSGLTIDYARLPAPSGGGTTGAGYVNRGPTNIAALAVYIRSKTTVSASPSAGANYYVNDTVPFAVGNTSTFQFFFTVPIKEWTTTSP